MKKTKPCGSITNFTAGLCASLIATVVCAQTAQPESTTELLQAEVAESVVTDSPAAPGAEAAEADAAEVVAAEAAAEAEGTEPVGAASAEVVELVAVDPPVEEDAEIAEPVIADPVPVELPPEPVKPRYKKDDVLWIQQRLEELGYYTGAVDGSYGKVTREAIKAYQADQELQQDGRPTPELRDYMWRNGG